MPTAAEAFRQEVQVAAKQLALQYQQVGISCRSSDTMWTAVPGLVRVRLSMCVSGLHFLRLTL